MIDWMIDDLSEEECAAVITAAISAYMQDAWCPTLENGLVVRSIRRIDYAR